MSRLRLVELPCTCGHAQPVRVADSMNVTRTPWARKRLLLGKFHCFECDACGAELFHRGPLLYTDVERRQCVLCRLPEEADDWQTWAAIAERAFWRPFPHANPGWQAEAGRYAMRLVFGLWALREKVLLWDAGIDDAWVEIIKLDLRVRQGMRGVPCLTAIDADHMVFRSALEPEVWRMPRAVLTDLAARRDVVFRRYPMLSNQVFTDYRRVQFPGVQAALQVRS